jgi:hypothetical protein
MLGEQFGELKGKITGQRVLDAEGPEAIGKIDSSGTVHWRGSLFYKSSSNGKLASLNNLVLVLEAEVDAEGNFSEKTWEWK